jgi:hypothetical protein
MPARSNLAVSFPQEEYARLQLVAQSQGKSPGKLLGELIQRSMVDLKNEAIEAPPREKNVVVNVTVDPLLFLEFDAVRTLLAHTRSSLVRQLWSESHD